MLEAINEVFGGSVQTILFFYLALNDKVASIGYIEEVEVRRLWATLYANGYVTDTTKGGIWVGPNAKQARFHSPIN